MYLLLIVGKYKLTLEGIFTSKVIHSANGKLKRDAWVRIFPRRVKPLPAVARSKADLKAEGDRLMGISERSAPSGSTKR